LVSIVNIILICVGIGFILGALIGFIYRENVYKPDRIIIIIFMGLLGGLLGFSIALAIAIFFV